MKRHVVLAAAAVFCAVLSSCGPGTLQVLPRQDLFTIQLGKMEDGVDLFQLDGTKSSRRNRVFMRNGIFYLSNGNSNKIMEFSSYGDLLGLLYNPQDNPKPVLVGEPLGQGRITNKKAMPYFFQEVGEIAMTRTGILLAEDQTPDAKREVDKDLGAVLNRVVLRFDPQGNFMDYLGQEGIGGAPFPYIEGLYVTVNDDIVVVCRTETQWLMYWYDSQGHRKYRVVLKSENFPVPNEGHLVPALVDFRPDPEFPQAYLHLDYYPDPGAAEPRAQTPRIESRVYTLNMVSGTYDSYFSLPYETQPLRGASEFEPKEVQSVHVLLGVGIGGRFYFTSRSGSDRYLLTVLDRSGKVLARRTLIVEDSKLVDRSFFVSYEGIISAFLGYEDHAGIVWWRADSLNGTPAPSY